jgi:hypothetical protein
MSFHRTLSHVQVPSDLRIVASLKQQFDDLPFPGSYLCKLFFHDQLHLAECAPQSLQVARKPGSSAHLNSVVASHFANSWPKQGVFRLIPRKFFRFAFFGGKSPV